MVTLTILGFFMLLILGTFRLGLSAWAKGESTKGEYQRARIVSQMIFQQLKSAVPHKVKTQKAEGDYVVFEGKNRSVKFVSTVSLKARKPSGLVYAFYEFREGDAGGGRLVLYEGRVVNKNFLDDPPPEEDFLPIFEGLADVRFEYFREEDSEKNREEGWVEEWNAKEEKELPAAIRVTLVPREGGWTEESPLQILASVPCNRHEEIRGGPVRRMLPPVVR